MKLTGKLITLEEFRKLSPEQQGYIAYLQSAWPGSELKGHESNPYPSGSKEYQEWQQGQCDAVIAAQDSEE